MGMSYMFAVNAANEQMHEAYIFYFLKFLYFCAFRFVTKAVYQHMYNILRNHAF